MALKEIVERRVIIQGVIIMPVLIHQEIVQEKMAAPQTDEKNVKKPKVPVVVYRVPAVCSVRLADGKSTLLQARVPVYQFGEETTLPVNLDLQENKSMERNYLKLESF